MPKPSYQCAGVCECIFVYVGVCERRTNTSGGSTEVRGHWLKEEVCVGLFVWHCKYVWDGVCALCGCFKAGRRLTVKGCRCLGFFFLKTDMMRRGELKIAKKTQTQIILSQMVPSIFNQEYHNVLRSVFNLFSFSRGQPNLNSLVKLDYIGWRKDFLVVSDVHQLLFLQTCRVSFLTDGLSCCWCSC